MGEDFAHFVLCQNDGKTGRPLYPLHPIQPSDLLPEDLLVKEEQSAQGLVLRRRCHLALASQISKELRHLGLGHSARVPFAVEEDKPPGPIEIGLFGPKTIMFSSDHVADLIEEFGLARGNWDLYGGAIPGTLPAATRKASGLLGRIIPLLPRNCRIIRPTSR